MNSEKNSDVDAVTSKTQLKKEMHQLQQLGAQLLTVKEKHLKKFDLSEAMLQALDESKRIKQHEAKRRHLQYIGKIIKHENIENIQKQLDLLDPNSNSTQQQLNIAERWLKKLIEDDTTHAQWFEAFPLIDRQIFRTLIRNAQKESKQEDTSSGRGKHTKRLFKEIRDVILK